MTINTYPPFGAPSNPSSITIGGTNVDAFGRLRVSNPTTLFDSQNRFSADIHYSYAIDTGGAINYNTNQSSVGLAVTNSSGSSALAQTFRVFSYQPGKGLLTLQTFVMNAPKTNLVQRVGLFSAYNGVYLEQGPNGITFVIRTYTSGSVNNSRFVAQSEWNGDKLNGSGPSGITLDLTKAQILWFDIEWLGVGNVRCGFIINGQYIVCHTFQNANVNNVVYMQTATLPLRYEITNTGDTASTSSLTMICSTVISEGGYEQVAAPQIARPTGNGVAIANATGLSFTPLVSIRINTTFFGAVVIPSIVNFIATAAGDYEVVLVRNPTLTGATWAGSISNGMVDVDTAATAMTANADGIVQTDYVVSTNQGSVPIIAPFGYNFDLQLGISSSLTGNGFGASDVFTLGARGINNSPAGSGIGSVAFYNLSL